MTISSLRSSLLNRLHKTNYVVMMRAHAVPRNVAVFVKSLTALIDPTAPSRRARAAGPGAQVCLGFLAAEWHNERLQSELRRLWLQVSSAQLSSMSARLHWLSMEREQGDRDGPPRAAPQWWMTPLRDSRHWQQLLSFMCFSTHECIHTYLSLCVLRVRSRGLSSHCDVTAESQFQFMLRVYRDEILKMI